MNSDDRLHPPDAVLAAGATGAAANAKSPSSEHERLPLMSTATSSPKHHRHRRRGFTAFTSICFTANYLIGTGFLTLPWAFEQGGLWLSTLTMVWVVLLCNTTKNYVLAAMAYAQELSNAQEEEETKEPEQAVEEEQKAIKVAGATKYGSLEIYSPKSPSRLEELKKQQKKSSRKDDTSSSSSSSSLLMVMDRKYEYAELCRIFLGNLGERLYVVCVGIAISLQLWGYAAVFGLGMAEFWPISSKSNNDNNIERDYQVYVVLFAALVVPLSCLELREQVGFQVLLSFGRFLVIYLMTQTAIAASMNKDIVYFANVDPVSRQEEMPPKLVDFSGFYAMFSVLVFTGQFHNGIPVLSEPVHNRKRLGKNFRDALVLVSTASWLLGAAVAFYFGSYVEQSANLNWIDYVGGTGHPSANHGGSLWVDVAPRAKAISTFVVLFPPLNMLSAYPLNAIVLGNNLLIAFSGSYSETSRTAKVLFRLMASMPPCLGAFFVNQLGIITSYSGVLAIFCTLSFPSLLYLRSKHALEGRRTCYDGLGSSDMGAYVVFAISIAMSIYILTKLIW